MAGADENAGECRAVAEGEEAEVMTFSFILYLAPDGDYATMGIRLCRRTTVI